MKLKFDQTHNLHSKQYTDLHYTTPMIVRGLQT